MATRPEATARELRDVRCGHCRRKLLRMTPKAVRRGELLELRCERCKRVAYLVGADELEREAPAE